jgi:DNA-binding CsgD family transcriptional regulator
MQIVDVAPIDGIALPLPALRDAFKSVGTPRYQHVMMEHFREAVGASMWSLMRLRTGIARSIEMAVMQDGADWSRRGLPQLRLYGPFDPLTSMAPAAPDEHGQIGLIGLGDVYHPAYRAECYDALQLRSRLSARVRCDSGDFQVNAYCPDPAGAAGASSIEAFHQVVKLLMASVDRHLTEQPSIAPAPPAVLTPPLVRERLMRLRSDLSPREVEVLSLAVRGHSVSDSAAQLGLALSTLATYRRRGFVKLGVGGASELLHRLLDQGTDTAPGRIGG